MLGVFFLSECIPNSYIGIVVCSSRTAATMTPALSSFDSSSLNLTTAKMPQHIASTNFSVATSLCVCNTLDSPCNARHRDRNSRSLLEQERAKIEAS